jgi:hypothetical protein
MEPPESKTASAENDTPPSARLTVAVEETTFGDRDREDFAFGLGWWTPMVTMTGEICWM